MRLGIYHPRDLCPAFAQLRLQQKGTTFHLLVVFGTAQRLSEALTHDQFDIVIASQRLPMPTVEYRKLVHERFMLVGSALHAVLAVERSTKTEIEEWLLEQDWISYGVELPNSTCYSVVEPTHRAIG